MEDYNRWHNRFMLLPRNIKRLIMVTADSVALVLALWSAFALRLSDWWPQDYLADAWSLFIATPVIGIAIFVKLGLYRAVVRYMNVKLLQSVALGVFLLVTSLYVTASFFDIWRVPRSIPIIFGLSAWLYLGGSRIIIRSYYHWLASRVARNNRALIYGAGAAGAQLVISLQGSGEVSPVAFIDDNPRLVRNTVCGLPVFSPSELEDIIARKNVTSVLLAITNLTNKQRAAILQRLAELPVKVKTMPSMAELIEGKAVDDLRSVEIEDLLGRDSVEPDPDLLSAAIKNKVVCVTGAGGSIGSELSRQALANGASTLVLFESSEYALYTIEQQLIKLRVESSFETKIIPIIGSVQDEARVEAVFKQFSVSTVFHAAAYKHVPLVEHNVLQGLANNTLGTLKAARSAKAASVERFVLISTDKAVRPTNVMGATKRFAELCVQYLASKSNDSTVFSMVRFGNVLGSSGSVVPLFREQIAKGGPVTITHPDINRFFMTIPEAASLVIQAGTIARGGEVFVLDMGEPVKITKLAESMIHLSGLTVKSASNPSGDIELMFSGLRPGEKLYEELLIGDNVIPTSNDKIMCAQEALMDEVVFSMLIKASELAIKNNDTELARETLRKAVVEFNPSSKNVDWLKLVSTEISDELH